MRRIYEFCCPEHGTFEAYREEGQQATLCPAPGCFIEAPKIISPVRSRLEGITGSFPTASDRWARVHEEAARVANKRNEGKYDA